jgi:anti-anti-sigma factor
MVSVLGLSVGSVVASRVVAGVMDSTRVVVTDRDGVPIVALDGEHDVHDAGALRRLLEEDLADRPRLVVDLTHTAFVDSTVVAVILSAHRRRRGEGGVSVVLGEGVLRRMFEVMRLDQVFDTFPTATAALSALRASRSSPRSA